MTVTTESLSILQCGSSNLNAAHCVFDCVAAPKSFAPHFLLCLLVMPTKSNSQSQPIQHNPSRDSEFQQLCTLSGFKHQVSRCLHRKCNHSLVLTSPMPNYIPPFLTSLTPSLSCSPHNRPSPFSTPFPLTLFIQNHPARRFPAPTATTFFDIHHSCLMLRDNDSSEVERAWYETS